MLSLTAIELAQPSQVLHFGVESTKLQAKQRLRKCLNEI
jgi:hypothetical protein